MDDYIWLAVIISSGLAFFGLDVVLYERRQGRRPIRPPRSEEPVIHMQRRQDGGLRVWSNDVPGLILSGRDPAVVMADILPALDAIRSHRDADNCDTFGETHRGPHRGLA